jgi:putative transposase
MDGRGRAFDNIFVERLWRSVKHEDVYLKGYATVGELTVGLSRYFMFYNGERPHQSLGYETPEVVYRTATGGGAMILDKYPKTESGAKPDASTSNKVSTSDVKTEEKAEENAKPGQRRPAVVKSNVQLKFNSILS